jgi:hypothetical protein
MASNSRKTWKRRQRRQSNAGRKRKNKQSVRSTKSEADLFAGMGAPGKLAPKTAAE